MPHSQKTVGSQLKSGHQVFLDKKPPAALPVPSMLTMQSLLTFNFAFAAHLRATFPCARFLTLKKIRKLD
jgi:hypothetical protein